MTSGKPTPTPGDISNSDTTIKGEKFKHFIDKKEIDKKPWNKTHNDDGRHIGINQNNSREK